MLLPGFVTNLLCTLNDGGAHPYLVGGCVRDFVYGVSPKDYDIEAHGVSVQNLESFLVKNGFTVDSVGKHFGVLIVSNASTGQFNVEVSVPRKDSKCGIGHKDFNCELIPDLPIEEALARRDFTINSMALDPFSNNLIDPFGGQEDLADGLLRRTSDSFSDDPLRVLRGAQFASRFGFLAEKETASVCESLADQYNTIPVERIRHEWIKLLLGKHPSWGLWFLRSVGWIKNYPQLNALINCQQDPTRHPEGDVFEHTLQCVDKMRKLIDAKADSEKRTISSGDQLVQMLSALCHDLGKPSCTQVEDDGRVTSYEHDTKSEEPTIAFMNSIGFCNEKTQKAVVNLVKTHMFGIHCQGNPTSSAVRRLSVKLAPSTIEQLTMLIIADKSARYAFDVEEKDRLNIVPAYVYEMTKLAKEHNVVANSTRPLLTGKHCVDLGMKPGPAIGKMISESFQAQLDGKFITDGGARIWAKERLDQLARLEASIKDAEPTVVSLAQGSAPSPTQNDQNNTTTAQ